MARRKNVKRIDPRYFLNETVLREEGLAFDAGDIIQYHPVSNPDDGPYNAVVDEVEFSPGHWSGRDVEQLRSGRWKISSTATHGKGVTGPYDLVVGVHPANDEEHIGF
tara:strand:- start:1046 stop:1369 length:324 start_codon:yes stop_codon:yes gene_type:complete